MAEEWQYVCRRCWCATAWASKSKRWYHIGPNAPGSCKRRGLEPEPMKRSEMESIQTQLREDARAGIVHLHRDFGKSAEA